jgi:hypothetical protein
VIFCQEPLKLLNNFEKKVSETVHKSTTHLMLITYVLGTLQINVADIKFSKTKSVVSENTLVELKYKYSEDTSQIRGSMRLVPGLNGTT